MAIHPIIGDMNYRILKAYFRICVYREPDPDLPGVFFVVSKPKTFRECSLDEIVLHSMVTGSRTVNITTSKKAFFLAKFKLRKAVGKFLPSSIKIHLGMKWGL